MNRHKGIYEKYIKRPLDFIIAALTLILLSPVLIIVAIFVKLKLGSPIIFTQDRPGLNGEIFKLYKFRTMTDEPNEKGDLLPDSDRLTNFGKFLRSTSLDELPELWNIVRGDMAIIGPRPLLIQYLHLYNEHQRRRHEVRPGLSGLAQVNGRNAICWEDRFNLDVEYVDHLSFIGDCRIIIKTLITVLKKEGINSETSATMEAFTGTQKVINFQNKREDENG